MKYKNAVLIGLGRQGKSHFYALKELLEMGYINKIYISDEDPNCIEDVGEKWSDIFIYIKVGGYTNIKDALFIVATPNSTHLQILTLIKKGMTILKEKPLAISDNDLTRIEELRIKNNLKIVTAQQRYFNDSYLKAKSLLYKLGEIKFFEYRYTLNDSKESWYWDEAFGGGCFLNVGWHFFFLLSWFLQDIPKIINIKSSKLSNRSLSSDISDTVFIDFKSHNSFGKAYLSVSECKKQDIFKIIGSNGAIEVNKKKCIVYDNMGRKMLSYKGNENLSYIKQISSILTEKNLDTLNNINSKTQQFISEYNYGKH